MRPVFAALLLTSTGCAIGAGPTVGHAIGRGTVLGWEADAGTVFLHAAAGQSFRPGPPNVDDAGERIPTRTWERVDWLAAQSWLLGGVTAGVADSDLTTGGQPLAGVWAGYPTVLNLGGLYGDGWRPVLLFAIGYRYLADAHELTLSARAGLVTVSESRTALGNW